MDMAFSNKGTLYLLEYGLNWFSQNEEAMLSRIEYNNGNRTPVVNLSVDKEIGAAPLTVHFSSVGSLDYDGDQLTYEWDFGPGMKKSKLANPIIKFKKAGEYNVKLNIKDEFGNVSSAEKIIKVGNEPPVLEIITTGNQTFYLGQDKIDYEVQVNDKEDGTLNAGINADDVVVSINYLEGYDKNMIAIGHQRNLTFASGRRLIDNNDCKSCHSPDQKSIGPAYKEIASKYTSNNSNINLLAEKIINGGGGVWGEQAMAAHPDLELKDAQSIVRYILSINDTQLASLPVKDQYNASDLMSKKSGAILIQASYSDKGGTKIGSLSNSTTKILRFPLINATQFDAASDNTLKFEIPENGEVAIANDNGYLAFDEIDLSGIKKILLTVFGQKGQTSGGVLQIRQDSETGMVVGEAKVEEDNILPVEIILGEIQEGTHILYLTFSNKNAEGKPLFALKTIEFK